MVREKQTTAVRGDSVTSTPQTQFKVWTSRNGRQVEYRSREERRLLEQTDRLEEIIDRRLKEMERRR